jgi:N-formylglutamate amidohydrolase
MDTIACQSGPDPAVQVLMPSRQTAPLVLASPHSGADYPEDLLAASALDPQSLRRSEDSFVDELFGAAPALGVPLVRALFPRAYVDPNREPYELDPSMFVDELPSYANTRSPRVLSGLGTIAKVVANGADIYSRKLTFAEAERRIEAFYRPFHRALFETLEATRAKFGLFLLVDCHSMPSVGGPMDRDNGLSRVEIVLGNCFGTSCAGAVTDTAEAVLRDAGYKVMRNAPYAGGYITRHYGDPAERRHALQIEVNRSLYMDEVTHRPHEGFERLRRDLTAVIAALAQLAATDLAAQ